ncbi:MAG: lysylphosphatidylglycerol synthase transmembrane domain-containing protein [Solirubrobacteraceae bacterium]|nr:lysylphosphatidylglycerol synthase transmembrane domain-containing protein [Solirubrobacteraceae bacterium]
MLVHASLGSNVSSFFDAVGSFFDSLSRVGWLSLLIGATAFVIYLSLRARGFFNSLRAAYPDAPIQYRRIWGAYIAAYGFNNVIPARGGDVVKLFLVKRSVPNSSYPAVGAAVCVEAVFDAVMAVFILTFAFSQGVFPKPPDFANLNAFDLSFFAAHPRFTLFLMTALAIAVLVGVALLSQRVKAFWARVRQGLTILSDRPRYLREVFAWQFAGWCFRFTAFWFLLEAFNIGGSVQNVLLVLGVNAVAAVVPFTPGGAGVQQALLVKVFAGTAAGATVAAYSVGQQIVIAVTTLAVGFFALATIFRIHSFKEAIRLGKEDRDAERLAEAEAKAAAGEAAGAR